MASFVPPQSWSQAMLGSKLVVSGWRGRKLSTSMASSASSSYRYGQFCQFFVQVSTLFSLSQSVLTRVNFDVYPFSTFPYPTPDSPHTGYPIPGSGRLLHPADQGSPCVRVLHPLCQSPRSGGLLWVPGCGEGQHPGVLRVSQGGGTGCLDQVQDRRGCGQAACPGAEPGHLLPPPEATQVSLWEQ